MNYDLNRVKALVDEIFAQIVALRRQLHRYPELSEHEENTSRLVCDQLSALGIPYRDHIAGYGVTGTIYGRDRGKAVGIRADMDALPISEKADVPFRSQNPGVMHACGHDMHTAILLGTAAVLSKLQNELPYSVRLFFQPSEETIGGARQMIEAGCLEEPATGIVIGLHVDPSLEAGCVQFKAGAMNAASCEFYVTVKGISCHGAHPAAGLDPLLPACEMVMSMQSIITRRLPATDSALITVGQLHSGTKNNIIPAESSFSGIIRTMKNEQRQYLKEQVTEVCQNIARSAGTTCEIKFRDSYPALVNDEALYELMTVAAADVLGKDKVKISNTASLGCDDFAYFCYSSRGLYYDLGTAKPGQTDAAPLHSDMFCPDEEAIRTGILTEAAGVLKIMEEMQNGK